MGTDDLFHRRKAKSAQDLSRKQSARQAYDKILIVCEGEKTEPQYFDEAIEHYKLHTANVSVRYDCGSAPINVYEHGLKLFQDEKKAQPRNPFDKVFLVFDRDQHETYELAMQKIAAQTPKCTFFAITSVPAFEYWLLLHFARSTRPFLGIENGPSAGKMVLNELKKYLPDYKKASNGIFTKLLPKLATAMTNADSANQQAANQDTDNPTTRVHELLRIMQNLKKTS